MSKTKIAILILVLLSAGGWWIVTNGKKNKEPKFQTEKIERGTITATVTATGTLAAVTTVKVGSQVSGIISRLYADFNSEVSKGQLLAELDPASFQAQVDQRKADLDRAMVEQRNARVAYERAKNLLENKLLSESEYDVAFANLRTSEAAVKQASAALKQATNNLSYTKIVSPIDGVVVQRDYDIGQTVAASFQAPTLFTIAQDLTRMQVSTNIDEADIGKITVGQEATFTVDAFPDRPYRGTVSQVRLSPQVVQNVVTYPVLIDVPNPRLELKPGMTANVSVPIDQRKDVLKVPNAALRFKPDPATVEGGRPSAAAGGRQGDKRGSMLYVMASEGKLRGVPVKTSITDGNYTAIESAELKQGDTIIVGLLTSRAMDSQGGFSQPGRRRP